MIPVKVWFPVWLKRHLERHQFLGLPDPLENAGFYRAWKSQFEACDMTEEAADIASNRLVADPRRPAWHFKQLLKIALDARRPAHGATDIDAARAASRSCQECYGEGIVSVINELDGTGMSAHCTCPYGRHLMTARRGAGLRVLDFADVLERQRFRIGEGEPFRYMRHENYPATKLKARLAGQSRDGVEAEQLPAERARPALPRPARPKLY